MSTPSRTKAQLEEHVDRLAGQVAELRRQIERQAQQSRPDNDRYRRLVEGLREEYFFFNTDAQGTVNYVSPSVEQVVGYAPEQILGRNWREFIDPSHPDNQHMELLERDLFAGHDVGPFQCAARHADGRLRYLRIRDVPLKDEQGQVVASEGIAKDITLRREAEQALRRSHEELEQLVEQRTEQLRRTLDELRISEQRYRNVVEDQSEMIVRWRPDGTRTFVNEAYCRYFGQRREQLLGVSFMRLIAPEDRQAVLAKVARLSRENPVAIDEHRVIRPDGSIGYQQWSDRALYDAEGRLIEYQSVGRDVTQARLEQEQQREQELAQVRVEGLSPREQQVMQLVAEGLPNKAISRRLEVSIKTIEKHRAAVMRKLHVRSLPELVRLVDLATTYTAAG